MLKLKGLTRNWNGFSLKDIDLEIARGAYYVLLGPSGSGKSLLLSTIAGIYLPDKGSISLKGRDITLLAPEKRRIGYVFQKNYLFPHLSVKNNITYGLPYQGHKKKDKQKTLRELNDLLDLGRIIERSDTEALSGGEAQKVALARALAIKPDLLLLDEPISSLDYDNRAGVIETLKRVNKELNMTTIHVTHDTSEANAVAQRIIRIKNGELE